MGYDRNLMVGWYVEFDQCTDSIQVGTKQKRVCPNNEKHNNKGEFCPTCGSVISIVDVPELRHFQYSHHIPNAETDGEAQEYTLGRATLADIKALGEIHVAFPEFFNDNKVRIMSPAFIYESDIGRSDSFVTEIKGKILEQPSQEWLDGINKVFSPTKLKLKFGLIVEVF